VNRRLAAAVAAAAGSVLFLLFFWLGWATDDTSRAQSRAVLLAAKPDAVAVMRLSAAPPLPELRRTARPRRVRTRTTSAAPRPAPVAERRRSRPAPRPVVIVGTG